MGVVTFWFFGAVIVGVIASSRGRSGVGYFLLSVVLSPVLGLVLAVALPSLKAAPGSAPAGIPNEQTHVRCAMCAEFILPEAAICKHCGAPHQPDPAFHKRVVEQKTAAASADRNNLFIGIAFLAGLLVVAKLVHHLAG